jgi:hypothetical protein
VGVLLPVAVPRRLPAIWRHARADVVAGRAPGGVDAGVNDVLSVPLAETPPVVVERTVVHVRLLALLFLLRTGLEQRCLRGSGDRGRRNRRRRAPPAGGHARTRSVRDPRAPVGTTGGVRGVSPDEAALKRASVGLPAAHSARAFERFSTGPPHSGQAVTRSVLVVWWRQSPHSYTFFPSLCSNHVPFIVTCCQTPSIVFNPSVVCGPVADRMLSVPPVRGATDPLE